MHLPRQTECRRLMATIAGCWNFRTSTGYILIRPTTSTMKICCCVWNTASRFCVKKRLPSRKSRRRRCFPERKKRDFLPWRPCGAVLPLRYRKPRRGSTAAELGRSTWPATIFALCPAPMLPTGSTRRNWAAEPTGILGFTRLRSCLI